MGYFIGNNAIHILIAKNQENERFAPPERNTLYSEGFYHYDQLDNLRADLAANARNGWYPLFMICNVPEDMMEEEHGEHGEEHYHQQHQRQHQQAAPVVAEALAEIGLQNEMGKLIWSHRTISYLNCYCCLRGDVSRGPEVTILPHSYPWRDTIGGRRRSVSVTEEEDGDSDGDGGGGGGDDDGQHAALPDRSRR